MALSPDFRFIETNAARYRVALAGKADRPLVLLVHGFPESWYSWRHQFAPLVEAGYRVAAPDVLGYGGSDKPSDISRYSMQNLTADMAGIVAALSPDAPAVVIGHDWGAPIAWNTALLHADRIRAVAGLSVPYTPPGEHAFIDLVKAVFTRRGKFFYQVYFQEPGVAEAELEKDPRDTVRRFVYAISGDAPDGTWPTDKPHGEGLLERLPDPDPMPGWMSEADLDYYESQFAASGFAGPLNRYRNQHRDHDFLRAVPDPKIYQPALFIGGTRDLVLKMLPGVDVVAHMKPNVPELRGAHLLEGCGHWTQQERPDEVNRLLLDWLGGLDG